ncbi:MAG: homoserine kinase [Chlamydiota bacterium]
MSKKSVKVFAPATVANIACGFDVLGFAVGEPGDVVKATLSDEPGVRIVNMTGDDGVLTSNPERNAATVGVIKLLQDQVFEQGVEIELHKQMPLGSGLGSSAASAAGGVFAANILLGNPLSRRELVRYAMEGERVACGSAHADNVAPALIGGFVAVRSYDPLDVIRIPTDLSLTCLLIKPHVEVMTEEARLALGYEISLEQHVVQTGNLSGLLVGLMNNDVDLIKRCLVDVIAEPKRSRWIPRYDEMKDLLNSNGAIGCCISGSGPSLFALFSNEEEAKYTKDKLTHFDADFYLTQVNKGGVSVIEESIDEIL